MKVLPSPCKDCKPTASLASGANGIFLNMQFASPWSVSVEVCLNGKSLCKSGILCTLLVIQPNSSVTVWFFLIIYFQYAIDSCDNRKHAVLSLNSAAMLYIPE